MSTSGERWTKKVCLVGDFAVGKTSLVRRFVEGCFDERYLSTIGVKVDRKVLRIPRPDGAATLTLMVWDLAGGPEIGPAAPSYYRGVSGAVLVCDVCRPDTLLGVGHYAEQILKANPGAQLVLAANKVDLEPERRLSDSELGEVAEALRAPLFLTSAKTGEQVEAMFQCLGSLLI